MKIISQITTDAIQNFSSALDDGSSFNITIQFIPQQLGWFITNLTYGTFILNGFRIVTSPNMLRQFKNQIPFGLACSVVGNREPTFQQDFASGNATLYILNSTDVQSFEDFLSGSS